MTESGADSGSFKVVALSDLIKFLQNLRSVEIHNQEDPQMQEVKERMNFSKLSQTRCKSRRKLIKASLHKNWSKSEPKTRSSPREVDVPLL
jgi:hypothetical protein